jgi:plastocyanin
MRIEMRIVVAAGTMAGLFAWGGSVVAGPGSIRGEIANPALARWPAVVYVEKIPGKIFDPPSNHPVLDQKSLVFIPHVLPVLVGTAVDFKNSDDVKHNIFSSRKSPTVFNLGTYGPSVVRSVTFDRPGVVTLLCNVHSEMSAYVVVVETPYFALTDREGHFAIDGVPPGSYQLKFWHEMLAGEPRPVVVEADTTATVTWSKPKRK